MSTYFSNFVQGNLIQTGDILVGLRNSTNYQFSFNNGFADAYSNLMVQFSSPSTSSAKAVNILQFTSALTGTNPILAPIGTDANIGIDVSTVGTGLFSILGTGGMLIPYGTTAQRPTGQTGLIRTNITTGLLEFWDNLTSTYVPVGTMGSISVTAPITSSGGSNPTIGLTTPLSPTYGGTGINNGSNTLTLAGNLTTAGAFATTFTFTGPTSVTFPTSGTLLTGSSVVTSITGTANEIAASSATGNVTLSISNNPILPGTGGVQIPSGSTAQRAGNAGTMRFNSQTTVFEGTVDGITWAGIGGGGAVSSVSGTANQIDVSPTTGACVVSIDANYAGQTSITTLGTITTGYWNSSVIPLAYGGTNANNTASAGGIVWSDASKLNILAGTATANQVLLSGDAATPAWSTATYPASTTINQILYSSANNTITGLATADNGLLITSALGVPSILADGTTGQVLTATTGSPPSWANSAYISPYVVNPTAGLGTYTTIQSAINAASSGSDVYITPGTYTEDLTLKVGVNLTTAKTNEQNPLVTIIGNATFTGTGTACIGNIELQSNGSNPFLTVSGSNASVITLIGCNLITGNTPGISYTSSSASSAITITRCKGDLTSATSSFYTMTSPGTITIRYCFFTNSGATPNSSTASAGVTQLYYNQFLSRISTTGTATININYCFVDCSAINAVPFTIFGSGTSNMRFTDCLSGTASAISINTGCTLNCYKSLVNSSNANAITGSGTLNYTDLSFSGSSSTINVTTQNPIALSSYQGGTGINNSGSTITVGGNVTFSGAYTFTGTLTNTTSVTFPTSGTLATTSQLGGFTWAAVTTATSLVAANGYFAANGSSAVTFTLPATAAVGDSYQVVANSAGTKGWVIAQNSGQSIRVGNLITTTGAGGSITSTSTVGGDWIEIICSATNSGFVANIKQGSATVV